MVDPPINQATTTAGATFTYLTLFLSNPFGVAQAISPLLSGRFPPQGEGNSHEVAVPHRGGGRGGQGIAPQICTIVSQCKSTSVPCKNFLWRLWRLVFSMLFGPSDGSPQGGEGNRKGGGGQERNYHQGGLWFSQPPPLCMNSGKRECHARSAHAVRSFGCRQILEP